MGPCLFSLITFLLSRQSACRCIREIKQEEKRSEKLRCKLLHFVFCPVKKFNPFFYFSPSFRSEPRILTPNLVESFEASDVSSARISRIVLNLKWNRDHEQQQQKKALHSRCLGIFVKRKGQSFSDWKLGFPLKIGELIDKQGGL